MYSSKVLERIEINPEILNGKPVIRGTRLSVQYILELLAQGVSVQEILEEYHRLTEEDLTACFLFAAHSLSQSSFLPLSA